MIKHLLDVAYWRQILTEVLDSVTDLSFDFKRLDARSVTTTALSAIPIYNGQSNLQAWRDLLLDGRFTISASPSTVVSLFSV